MKGLGHEMNLVCYGTVRYIREQRKQTAFSKMIKKVIKGIITYIVSQDLSRDSVPVEGKGLFAEQVTVRGELRVGYLSSKAKVTSMLVNVRIQDKACDAMESSKIRTCMPLNLGFTWCRG
jgi:hypothetical protein